MSTLAEKKYDNIDEDRLQKIIRNKKQYENVRASIRDKKAKAVILILPSGEEKEFISAMAASRYLKGSTTLVQNWLKSGPPNRGKFKDYNVRYAVE